MDWGINKGNNDNDDDDDDYNDCDEVYITQRVSFLGNGRAGTKF